jgi:hypothetical protein
MTMGSQSRLHEEEPAWSYQTNATQPRLVIASYWASACIVETTYHGHFSRRGKGRG